MILKNALNEKVKNELNKIKDIEKREDRGKCYYRMNEYAYNFQNFRIINTFGRDIHNGTITLKEHDKKKSDLLVEVSNFRKHVKPKNKDKKIKERRYS